MQDDLMIKYIKKRKEIGMEIFIDKYRGIITAVVRRHLGSLEIYEEECISDVFLSVWDNIKQFDKDKNDFKNWVCAISKYKAIDYKRKYLSKMNEVDVKEDIQYIDCELMRLEIEQEVEEILGYLSERDRSIFIQHYIEGESLVNIASKDNTKVSNIYNRISRGRQKLRECCLRR